MKKKQGQKKFKAESWHYCMMCHMQAGRKVPKDGFKGITVTIGVCPGCKEETTLIPTVDYLRPGWD
jgi:hypothetical protein